VSEVDASREQCFECRLIVSHETFPFLVWPPRLSSLPATVAGTTGSSHRVRD
jgi:hypothetical protein